MAVYGIVADIHGNSEALAAALGALDHLRFDRLLCLGDIVGYNADPDACVAMLQARGALAIAGNHDLIALHRLDFARCSNKARYALERTRRTLSPASAAYLESLPACRTLEGSIALVHGGVRDVQQYMVTHELVRLNAGHLAADFPQARLCFFGHSHEQKIYEIHPERVAQLAPAQSVSLDRGRLYFVNPGSVDASRKRGGKLAEFARFDSDAWRVELCAVAYDCAATEAKAAVFGYRIPPLLDGLYTLRRRVLRTGSRRASAR